MILRLCLKDKSSVLVVGDMQEIAIQAKYEQFIMVENYNTGKKEMYDTDYIWCIRESSKNKL